MAARYKRHIKNYFIKKDYQGRFALVIFAAAIVSCLASAVLAGLFLGRYNDHQLQQ